jgi:folate-binding protein YgfZ
MTHTALQTQGKDLGAMRVDEYRGAQTAGRFADPLAEFAALRTGCGVYDLGFRAQISLTGSDRVRWLNGMVTNNIRDLAPGQGVYAFLLNPQGRILGDLYAYNRGDSITVNTDRSQREKLLATFDHYIIMDDVEVADLSGEWTALGVAGSGAPALLAAEGLDVPESTLEIRAAKWRDLNCSVVRGEDASFEIWLPPEGVRPLWDALRAAGATPVGFEALELQRIAAGVPRYGVDIREKDLPQETEQARALNFNKGCYVGQEIVERIRSRGAVHRKFSGFMIEGAAQIAPGIKIVAGEKDAGEVTSAAVLGAGPEEKTVVLGYIRREFSAPGREVKIGSTSATVVSLPVSDSVLQGTALEHHPA